MSTILKLTLVKLASEQLLQVLGFNAYGVRGMFQNATSWMETDEDLQKMIRCTRCVYARRLKMAWDVKNWDQKSNRASWTEQLIDVLDFHESKIIHRR
jgi:hypothetical protein